MRRRYLIMALAVILISSMLGVGTMAYFTSSVTSTDNTYNTGTLDIRTGNADGTIPNFVISSMQPSFYYPQGDEDNNPEYAYDPVKGHFILRNHGSLPAKVYRMTVDNIRDTTDRSVGTKASKIELMKKVYVVVTAKGYTPSVGTPVPDDILYVGTLYNMQYENGGYFDPFVFMNQGDQREIEFAVALASSANNSYQNMSLMADFSIHATQKEAPVTENETNPTNYTTIYNDPARNNLRLDAKEGYHQAIDHDTDWVGDNNNPPGFTGDAYEFRFFDEKGLLPAMKSMTLELKHESDNRETVKVTRVIYYLWEDDKLQVENIALADVDYKDIIAASDKYIYISKDAVPDGWKLVEVRATYNWSNNTSTTTGWLPYAVSSTIQ